LFIVAREILTMILLFQTQGFILSFMVLHHCIDLFLGPPMGQLRGRSSRRRKRMAHFTST
jgi:hypothetical protein